MTPGRNRPGMPFTFSITGLEYKTFLGPRSPPPMEFNLDRILLALLFATSEPLPIKAIQAVISRYHEQNETDEAGEAEAIGSNQSGEMPRTENGGTSPGEGQDEEELQPESDGQQFFQEVMSQVPSLLPSTRIREAMDRLAARAREQNLVYRVQESPQGYRLVIAPGLGEWVRLLRNEPRPRRLGPALLETLAIVAYRQPVTRAEIESIRGVSADNALNRLLDMELIQNIGRADLPGRPMQYSTTDHFLEFAGLRSLDELPASDVLSPRQITEWLHEQAQGGPAVDDDDVGLPSGADDSPPALEAPEASGLEQAPREPEAP